ncbi:hypothetical protein BBO99_00005752 [Phytophthora kernoviae]|uniref:Uncharacterized protein n=2 Tax=Phytophthora kernoviae TaxID=325452 RepID=A0A3R7INR4_9STRA|nr:hypothetical protein G195_006762 [Phytophthora kernoviae 00238/432]KAG2525096.1 hypothetical protein JM18_004771 [Phytophthora kernoviae]KAG2527848.1 hypothetical protein JM16_002979 [Phytophthora kernoviae]RLN43960.1 hypothetical protein BBI17_003378 [Phytophthora kernoviae]RLN78760.1 hypothetical protein BBO99_00005752 [Phytophthora kernoviae]
MSAKCGYQDGDNLRFQGSFVSSGYTHSTTSYETGVSTIIGSDDGEMDNDEKDFKDPMTGKRRKTPSSVYQLEMETSRGVLIGLANNLFCGNLWLTRITVAGLVTAIWTIISTTAFLLVPFPVVDTPRDLDGTPYYFWAVNFVTTLCAFSCPTWPFAFSLVVQKSVFQVLLQNAFNCPLAANRECADPPLTSMQAYVLGVMAVILVRAFSARGPATLVVSLTLDLLGYAYISGALGLLITMVDPSDSNATWAAIWLGMLSAMWVAQFAAYCCDAMMYRFQIPHMRLLPRHIVVTLDVEASLFAIAAGSLALVFGGAILDVPGGVLPKVLFTIASVLMARFGRLILSVLKKASGVRWSGRLMPGFGGVLDAI